MMLTAAGIYGVLAFAIARRLREIAIRLTLGATRADVIRIVASHALVLASSGTALGVGLTFWLTRMAQGVGGVFDAPGPAAFLVPVLMMVVLTMLSTWLPARRAARVDPAVLLRMP